MAYTVTDIKPDFQNEWVDVTVAYDNKSTMTFHVKCVADLIDAMVQHDKFLSDVAGLSGLLTQDIEKKVKNG